MEENKVTNEEIVKDIERSTGMPSYWKKVVLDLIRRLQSENEKLKCKKILAYKVLSDSTLKSETKVDLIERIRILEHNWSCAEESLANSVKNSDKIFFEQKAEIERLAEEKGKYQEKWQTSYMNELNLQKEIGQISQSYMEVCDINAKLTEENGKYQEKWQTSYMNELNLQKQVDELTAENAILNKQVDRKDKEIVREMNIGYENERQAVTNTAKEIFTELLKGENVCEEVVDDYYGGHYIMSAVTVDKIREIAKERYGVEVK